MHPQEIDNSTGLPTKRRLKPGTPANSGCRLQLSPKFRCYDCPRKLYSATPSSIMQDLCTHIRNSFHQHFLTLRLSLNSQGWGSIVQAVFHAIRNSRLDLLKETLADEHIQFLTQEEKYELKRGPTAANILAHAVNFARNVDMLLFLLEQRFDAQAIDNDQRTALHFACYLGRTEIAHCLVTNGAGISSRDSRGKRPLDLAIDRCDYNTAIRVLESLAFVQTVGNSACQAT